MIVVDATNGHGHRDDGADRDARAVKPCCARLPNHAWCVLPEGHDGRCIGFETTHPPPDLGLKRKP